jgi:hypothetical protein
VHIACIDGQISWSLGISRATFGVHPLFYMAFFRFGGDEAHSQNVAL